MFGGSKAVIGLDVGSYAVKAVVVGGLTSLPMLFSGVIFARSFTNAVKKDEALGANLIGALVGGLLQSITFVVGIRALLWIVAGLYFAAMLTRPKVPARTEGSSPAFRPMGDRKSQAGVGSELMADDR